jgi:hypothetical protein
VPRAQQRPKRAVKADESGANARIQLKVFTNSLIVCARRFVADYLTVSGWHKCCVSAIAQLACILATHLLGGSSAYSQVADVRASTTTWVSHGNASYSTYNLSVVFAPISDISHVFSHAFIIGEAGASDIVIHRRGISSTTIPFDSPVTAVNRTLTSNGHIMPSVALDKRYNLWTAAFEDLGDAEARYLLTARHTSNTRSLALTFDPSRDSYTAGSFAFVGNTSASGTISCTEAGVPYTSWPSPILASAENSPREVAVSLSSDGNQQLNGTTPTAQLSTTVSGVVMDQSGTRLERAVLFVFDLGLSVTQADGFFSIEGAIPGQVYSASIRTAGPRDYNASFRILAGIPQLIIVPKVSDQIQMCPMRSLAPQFQIMSRALQKILSRIKRDRNALLLDRTPDNREILQPSEIEPLNTLIAQVASLPTTTYNCSATGTPTPYPCTRINLRQTKKNILSSATSIRRTALLLNRRLRETDLRGTAHSTRIVRDVRAYSRNLTKAVRSIPNFTYQCPSS